MAYRPLEKHRESQDCFRLGEILRTNRIDVHGFLLFPSGKAGRQSRECGNCRACGSSRRCGSLVLQIPQAGAITFRLVLDNPVC